MLHSDAHHRRFEVDALGARDEVRCFCGGQQTFPTERKDEVVPNMLSRSAARKTVEESVGCGTKTVQATYSSVCPFSAFGLDSRVERRISSAFVRTA